MIMKVTFPEVVWSIFTVKTHAGYALVQPCFVVLKILKDTLYGTSLNLRGQRLEADILQCDVCVFIVNFHVGNFVLKI